MGHDATHNKSYFVLFCFVLFSPKASDSETQPIKQAKLSRSGQVRVGTKQS